MQTLIAGQSFIKIGRTNNVEKRIVGVQTGCPMPVKIAKCFECENSLRVENDSHRALRFHNTSGEWFSCSVEDAERIILASIAGKTGGKNRKRYKRPKQTLALFSDSLDA